MNCPLVGPGKPKVFKNTGKVTCGPLPLGFQTFNEENAPYKGHQSQTISRNYTA